MKKHIRKISILTPAINLRIHTCMYKLLQIK